MREFGYAIVDLLVEHFAGGDQERVGAKSDPAKLIPMFDHDPPETGRDPNELLAQFKRDVLPNNLHVDHPRFFAFVPGSSHSGGLPCSARGVVPVSHSLSYLW